MTNLKAKDYDGNADYIKTTGSGTNGDPHVPIHAIEGLTLAEGKIPVADAAILEKLSSDPATQTTLAALLAKTISAPATEAKQDTIKTAIDAITTKLSSDPATQTTLAAVNDKLPTLRGGKLPVTGKDDGPAWTTSSLKGYSADASSTPLDITGAPGEGLKIVITDLYIWTTTPACVISLYEESNATSIMDIPLPVNGQVAIVPRSILKNATAGKKFQLKTSVAVPVYTFCLYRSEA